MSTAERRALWECLQIQATVCVRRLFAARNGRHGASARAACKCWISDLRAANRILAQTHE